MSGDVQLIEIVAGETGLVLGVGVGGSLPPGCGEGGGVADDGTPGILGSSALPVSDLRAWWSSPGRGQPSRLGIAIEDLIALYLSEGDAEGVRGDMALAQAVLETAGAVGKEAGVDAEGHAAVGDIGTEVAAQVGHLGCDAIVMGTRGRGAVTSLLLGSTTMKVIHLAEVPIALIK